MKQCLISGFQTEKKRYNKEMLKTICRMAMAMTTIFDGVMVERAPATQNNSIRIVAQTDSTIAIDLFIRNN